MELPHKNPHKNPTIRRLRELANQHEDREFRTCFRARRRKKKMTQAELAEKIGVDQPVIARFEMGRVDPALLLVRKIAKALDADLKLVIR